MLASILVLRRLDGRSTGLWQNSKLAKAIASLDNVRQQQLLQPQQATTYVRTYVRTTVEYIYIELKQSQATTTTTTTICTIHYARYDLPGNHKQPNLVYAQEKEDYICLL